METSGAALFHEEQRFGNVWWIMLVILVVAALTWWGFIQQIGVNQPWGSDPSPDWAMWLLWGLFGIGMPLLFWYMGLIVDVNDKGLSIQFFPLLRRSVFWSEIRSVTVVSYKPLRQFGGWGIRGFSNHRAYSVKGNRGVEITLANGNKLLIGSQKAEEMARVIKINMNRQTGQNTV